MYSPQLGAFLTRDPLPQNGGPDVLYDNNWFGDWLTMMRNLYGYTSGNPANRLDPSGLVILDFYPEKTAGVPWLRVIGDTGLARDIRLTSRIKFCKCPGVHQFEFKITAEIHIVMDTADLLAHFDWLPGVYGHEQAHLENWREFINEWVIKLKNIEDEFRCKKSFEELAVEAQLVKVDFDAAVKAFGKSEGAHDNPKGPKNEEPRPPRGKMPDNPQSRK